MKRRLAIASGYETAARQRGARSAGPAATMHVTCRRVLPSWVAVSSAIGRYVEQSDLGPAEGAGVVSILA
mgnify:CR=1 FL=1